MEKVTPEHFFCGLLKFAELEANDLISLAKQASLESGVELGVEQEQVADTVNALGLDSTEVRRAVRSAVGKGNANMEGEVLHRSNETHELFERASRAAAAAGDTVLHPVHLLADLAAHPTPLLQKYLGKQPSSPTPEEPAPLESKKKPLDSRWFNLGQKALDGDLHAAGVYDPQIKVLAWAINQEAPAHLLLICAPQLDLDPILGTAFMKSQKIQTLLEINLLKCGITTALDLDEIIPDCEGENNELLLVNTCGLKFETVKIMMQVFTSALQRKAPRLACAVQEDPVTEEVTRQLFEPFCRVIWLHDLTAMPGVDQI